ncbi:MAG: CHAT domain-containing protein [Muribaculum sp.]|nr:CHAT domain-containing protein [Muribaculum sp.]
MIEMSRLSSTREICREHPSQPLRYAALFGNIDYLGDAAEASDKRGYHKSRGAAGLNFIPLENTEREVREINGILKSNMKKANVFTYTEEKAGKSEFLSQDELPVNLIHIATHGINNNDGDLSYSDAMSRSILAFAGANLYGDFEGNEGIVTAAEIAEMSLQGCDLAVLSACESGLGKLGNDGVFGLQRGFKNAGVKTLLVSLNEVADESTADMMIAFNRNLVVPGTTKSEAFKKAQSEIRTKYPNDNTWASFILIDSFN